MTYEEIKKKHKLTDKEIGTWFSYKTANSFRRSTKFEKIKSGIESFYSKITSDKEIKKEEVKEIINREIEKI